MDAVEALYPLTLASMCEPSTVTSTAPPTAVFDERMPLPELFVICVFFTFRFWLPVACAPRPPRPLWQRVTPVAVFFETLFFFPLRCRAAGRARRRRHVDAVAVR